MKRLHVADLERIFGNCGIKPVLRTNIDGKDVFVADGFVPPSHQRYLSRFGVGPTEYPFGCFITAWLTQEKHGWRIGIAENDARPNGGSLSLDHDTAVRVRKSVELAKRDFAKMKAANG